MKALHRYRFDGFENSTQRGLLVRDSLQADQLRKWYWDEQRSIPQISRISGVPSQTLYELMRQHKIPRRTLTESNYLIYKDKPKFRLQPRLTPEQERLKVAGLMLYWAEGAKQRSTVDFTNSDPKTIMIFLRFLREICGVSESRLRGFLYIYEGQNIENIRQYWSEQTQIPEEQFLKSYVSKFRPERLKQKVLSYGVMHVRYNDKRLLQQILSWIQEEADRLILRAGTQAANEARL